MAQTTRVISRGGLPVRVMRTARVEVVDGPDRGRSVVIDRPRWRIGTHASNDLALTDDTVSKAHLELAAADDGYRIVDLGSSNGTFLDGLRIGEVTVARAVTLQLGRTRLVVTPASDEAEVAASQATAFGALVGRSAAMRELFAELDAVAGSDVSLLLEGETGVGKEVVAASVHGASPRRERPFVVVDCAALAGELLESELFGHVRGAFTGAHEARAGLIEAADGGTLFLDEIGELPLGLQTKLLGALERRQLRRVGASTTTPFDVRVIAATNRDLAREVNDGRFRADLYYRIAVVRLCVPPLRERLEDIPLLVEHFLSTLGGDVPAQLSSLALGRLAAQPWPGNVRELRNAIERAALLPPALAASTSTSTTTTAQPATMPAAPPRTPLFAARADALAQFERDYFTDLLARAGNNRSEACRLSRLDRRYLYRILDRLGLD